MSDFEEKSNRLIEGKFGTPLGYYLSTIFHPAISLNKKLGYEFATSLSEYLEIDASTFESNAWHMSSKRDGVSIEVGESHILLSCEKPAGGMAQEWYEHRYREVLIRFSEKFHPQIALASKAMMRQLFEIDGDARDFLSQHVMGIQPERFGPLQRPIQLLGMRIAFPPYIREQVGGSEGGEADAETTDWLLELKVESWAEDPKMLFVEADASWHEPMSWDDTSGVIEKIVGRLGELNSYLSKVRDFLDGDRNENI